MSTTATGHCPHCAAVVNVHWPSCLVCHALLSPTAETVCTSLAAPLPTIQVGDRIEWQRADLTIQTGEVDYLHVDAEGKTWAFCTLPDGGWSAVNVQYIWKKAHGHDGEGTLPR